MLKRVGAVLCSGTVAQISCYGTLILQRSFPKSRTPFTSQAIRCCFFPDRFDYVPYVYSRVIVQSIAYLLDS